MFSPGCSCTRTCFVSVNLKRVEATAAPCCCWSLGILSSCSITLCLCLCTLLETHTFELSTGNQLKKQPYFSRSGDVFANQSRSRTKWSGAWWGVTRATLPSCINKHLWDAFRPWFCDDCCAHARHGHVWQACERAPSLRPSEGSQRAELPPPNPPLIHLLLRYPRHRPGPARSSANRHEPVPKLYQPRPPTPHYFLPYIWAHLYTHTW